MGFNLIASGQVSGTGTTIVSSPSTKDVPLGALIVALGYGVTGTTMLGVSDNAGVGNSYSVSTPVNTVAPTLSTLLAAAVAAAKTPAGTVWTFSFNAVSPAGRMFSIGYFDDALGSAPVLDQNVTPVAGATTQNPSISSAGLAQAQELVVCSVGMKSNTAGGVADSIALDGSLTPMDNRNHTGTVTAYMAWGYKIVNSQNAVNDSASFQAADSYALGMMTFKLQIPSAPVPSSYTPNSIIHPGYHGV